MMYNLLSVSGGAIVDVVALVILGVYAVRGFQRGFIKSFFSTFGTILSLIIAVLLAPKVVPFLENSFSLATTISNALKGYLTNIFGDTLMNTTLEQASEEFMAENGLFSWLINAVLEIKNYGSIPLNTTLNDIICPTLSYYISMVICVIILFIIFKIIFFIIGEIAKKLHALTVFALLDKSLGIVFGLANGIIFISFITFIINIIPIELFVNLSSTISTSVFVGFIQKIDVYGLIFNSFSKINLLDFIKSAVSS